MKLPIADWRNVDRTIHLYKGDCLKVMPELPDQCANMILADLPYGTTACTWDTVIPLSRLWGQYRGLIKPNGVIVLTASQPFTSALVMSNPEWFKYSWVWEKSKATGFQDVRYRPLKSHEDVLVFSGGGCSTGSTVPTKYNPQGVQPCYKARTERNGGGYLRSNCKGGGIQTQTNWPKSVLSISSQSGLHATQKPLQLFKYLIRTYTNFDDVVLDNTIGSGTTAIACKQLGRKCIGIEQDAEIFEVCRNRVQRQCELT